ncbi:MAG: hypothetical protein ACOCZ9_02160, partial [Spirochaetota bacterium]
MKKALLMFIVFSLVSFSAFGGGQAEETARSTLRVAVPTFPNSIDASIAAERNAQNVAWQMFDSLVFQNNDAEI